MTAKKDLKELIRQRMAKTGESFTAARAHVLAAREAPTGGSAQDTAKTQDETTTQPSAPVSPKIRVVRLHNSDEKAPIAGLHLYQIDVHAYWSAGLEFLVAALDPECGPYSDCRIARPADVPVFLQKGFRELTSWESEEAFGAIEDYTEGWKHSDW